MNQQSAHQVNRIIHDADSHISEYDGWIEGYASEYVRANLDEPFFRVEEVPQLKPLVDQAHNRLAGNDPAMTEHLKSDIFGSEGKRNIIGAYGAVNNIERTDALDIAGISKQLVFPGFVFVSRFSRSNDEKVVWGGCDANK